MSASFLNPIFNVKKLIIIMNSLLKPVTNILKTITDKYRQYKLLGSLKKNVE